MKLTSQNFSLAPSGALFFFTYDFLKRELLSSFSPSYYPICHMIAASGGEIVLFYFDFHQRTFEI